MALLLGALLTPLLVLLRSDAAAAHAELVATDPPSGEDVPLAPTAIVLRFSEDVTVADDAIRLYDAGGVRIALGPSTASGATVRAETEGPLPDSAYVVSWRVTSDDGHPIAGSFVFAVGSASVTDAPAVGEPDDALWEAVAWIARAVATGGLLSAVGLTMASLLGTAGSTGLGGLQRGAAIAAIVASVLGIPAQAALQTGAGLGALGREGALGDALAGGVGWSVLLLGCSLGVLAGAAGGDAGDGSGRRRLQWGAVVAAAVAPALTGHTRSADPELLAVLVDALHVAAASAWVGALVTLRGGVRPWAAGPFPASSVRLAVVGVATAATAGLAMAWSQVGSVEALWSTRYGGLLLTKTAVVAVAVGIGRRNRGRGSRRALTAELVLVVGVVALTALLVQEPPPGSAAPARTSVAIAAFGEGTVEVTAEPSDSGVHQLRFVFLAGDGEPDDRWDEVVARASRPDLGIEGIRAVAAREEPGRWRTSPVPVPVAGTWTIELFAGTADGTAVSATVELDLG